MNRFILSILAVTFSSQMSGQMFPLSDHYIYNMLAINPAFAGCHDALSATLSYRNQWIGFKDAPKDLILSVHAPVAHDRIGLGLLVEDNSIGIFHETSFMGNYAYKMEVHDGILALGLAFGAARYHIAWDDLEATDSDDELLLDYPKTEVLPNFSLGTYYYTKKYFIGISLPLFLSHEPDQNSGKYKLKNDFSNYNYFFTGGYTIGVSPRIKLLPSVLIKYHPGHSVQFDSYAQVIFMDRIWMGAGYRSSGMLIGMLQCQLNYQLRMAYSYDFDTSRSRQYKNGSHEVVLSYVFKYERRVKGPRQF